MFLDLQVSSVADVCGWEEWGEGEDNAQVLQPLPPTTITYNHYHGGTEHSKQTVQEDLIAEKPTQAWPYLFYLNQQE